MWITRTSINQPVFATMVMLALVVLGLFSYRLLPVEEMPEISMPEAYITVEYPGASPEAIEDEIVKPIENVINSIDGVRNIYATAREGRAFFQIEFRLETDVIAATQEIRDKVAQIRSTLPREVREPKIERASSESQQGAAVEMVVYSGTRSLREVSTLVEQQIVKRLQNSYGVGHIEVGGSVQRQVQVYLRPEQLQSLRVGVDQVIAAIRAANQDLPAGSISRAASEQLVRVEGRIKDPRGFERIIVANQGGAPVYLGQVADIVDGEMEEQSIARVDGMRSVSLSVYRAQQANLVKVGAGVEEAIAELQRPPARGRQDPRAVVGCEVDRRLARPGQGNDLRRRDAHDPDRVPVPAFVALDGDHRPDAADLGDCHVHRAARLRLLAELHDADGAVAVHRPADRRRHRGAREHRAPLADGQEPPRRGVAGHAGDRRRRDGDDVRDPGRVHPGCVHERRHRPLLPAVRHHRRGRGAGVAVRQLHARPDAVVDLAGSERGPVQAPALAAAQSWIASSAWSKARTCCTTACSAGRSADVATAGAGRASARACCCSAWPRSRSSAAS